MSENTIESLVKPGYKERLVIEIDRRDPDLMTTVIISRTTLAHSLDIVDLDGNEDDGGNDKDGEGKGKDKKKDKDKDSGNGKKRKPNDDKKDPGPKAARSSSRSTRSSTSSSKDTRSRQRSHSQDSDGDHVRKRARREPLSRAEVRDALMREFTESEKCGYKSQEAQEADVQTQRGLSSAGIREKGRIGTSILDKIEL
ncbi:uncharacterized protein BDV14DRAFT_197660 [Aspergillus stella-maris]|uniref:uncharacterized protein n=1 Tax=Aspergillus stella-maris TaxID=1810926 RepID=UPI003CCE528C